MNVDPNISKQAQAGDQARDQAGARAAGDPGNVPAGLRAADIGLPISGSADVAIQDQVKDRAKRQVTAAAATLALQAGLARREGQDMARRRFQRTGTLAKDGNWWRLRYYEYGAIGQKPRRPSEILGPARGVDAITEKEAKRRAAAKLREVNLEAAMPGSAMLLDDFLDRHFLPEHVATLKRGGQVHYRVTLAHLRSALGSWALRDIKYEQVQKLCLGMLARTYKVGAGDRAREVPYSVQSVLHLKNAVSAVFEHATALGMYDGRNPARYVRLPEMERKPKHVLSADQVRKLLASLPDPARQLAELAVLTSMNIAEICGLQWRDVNLTRRWVISDGEPVPPMAISVRRQFRNGEYGTLKKSARAAESSRRRDLPIDAELLRLLKELQPAAREGGPREGGPLGDGNGPVFRSRAGTPVDAHNVFNRQLKPVGRALGMPWIGWHTLRHTHATLLRQGGAGAGDQMAMMGHSTLRMTMNYGEGDLARRRAAIAGIARKIAPKKKAAVA